jgi:hypothetical protein
MRWDPQASWIQGNNRTMHWDPNENWNADVSVADAVHRRNSNRLEQVALNANEFVSSPELAAIVASAVANQRQGGKSRKHKKSNQKHKKSNQKHKKSNQKHKKSIRRRKH